MLSFIKQSLLHPRRTGAIAPSSRHLAQAMLEPVDFAHAKHIVELGPGTGVFTRMILRRMRKDARLTVIELNPLFCKNLKNVRDPRLTIINGDARDLSSVKHADYVISSLPLNAFNKSDRIKIIHEIKHITDSYIQFQYFPFGEKYFKENFKVRRKFVLKNIPPAIVYTASVN